MVGRYSGGYCRPNGGDALTESETGTWRWVLRALAAALSLAAAAVHFSVAGEHFHEYWLFGVFFLVVSWLQVAWAGAIMVTARRSVLAAGVVLQLAVVLVWTLSRTGGVPLVPGPSTDEPVGWLDGFSTGVEVAAAVVALSLLGPGFARALNRTRRLQVAALTAFAVMASTSAALALSPTESGDGGMDMGGADTAASALQLRVPTTSPAGDIRLPISMEMEGGMKMVTSMCAAMPSQQQQEQARALVDQTVADDSKYASLATAKADGFVPITPSGLPVVHYMKITNFIANMRTGNPLTPDAPASLVYANTPKGAVLVAVMYMMGPGTSQPPSTGGCLVQWHVHTNLCLSGVHVVALQDAQGNCPQGSVAQVTPPMTHVWMVPIPDGPLGGVNDADAVRAAEKVSNPNGPGSVA